MELIKISTSQKGNSVVSGRELHAFLEVKTKFVDWIKNQCERAMLEVNMDYAAIIQPSEKKEGSRLVEREQHDVVAKQDGCLCAFK